MEKKDWIILQTVHEEKNITKAADRLFMSQPTLTYRLQQIEKEYGIKLLYRGRRGVEFTEQGEFLVKYADKMLIQLRDMEEALWNLGENVRGTLRLSVARSVALYQLPKVLKSFSDKHPQIDFSISTGLNLDLIQSIYKQDSHIGIVRGNHHWPYEKHIITEENICIIADKEVKLGDLPTMKRICYSTDPALNMVIDNWWKNNFSTPPVVSMNVSSMEIAKRMVTNGLGYAIVPSIVLEEYDNLHTFNLTDKSGDTIKWTTWILYRKEFLTLSMVKEFVEFITNYFCEDN